MFEWIQLEIQFFYLRHVNDSLSKPIIKSISCQFNDLYSFYRSIGIYEDKSIGGGGGVEFTSFAVHKINEGLPKFVCDDVTQS